MKTAYSTYLVILKTGREIELISDLYLITENKEHYEFHALGRKGCPVAVFAGSEIAAIIDLDSRQQYRSESIDRYEKEWESNRDAKKAKYH